jgi:hypothetical protein
LDARRNPADPLAAGVKSRPQEDPAPGNLTGASFFLSSLPNIRSGTRTNRPTAADEGEQNDGSFSDATLARLVK